jgi:nicotinamide phosphoribosyltransferase
MEQRMQEHSVMTAWPTEREAILNMIDHFGEGVYACVMDSYDYAEALARVLPSVKSEKVGKGGFLVLRPDSGDPKVAVLQVCSRC